MMTADSGRDVFAKRDMKRRVTEALLFTWLVLTGAGWTETAWGEGKLARVGILTSFVLADDPSRGQWFEPFRGALADQGWIEGKNFVFEYRDSGNDLSKIAEAAAALAALKVDVIWAPAAPMLRAASAATRTIPIVAQDFTTDPIAERYVESYRRPGSNVTGVFLDAPGLAGKWFELLTAMIPDLSRVVVLWDPGPGPTHLRAVQSTARGFGIALQVLEVGKVEDVDRVLSAFRERPQAILVLPSPWIYTQSEQLAKLTLKHRLPGISMARLFADSGGLVAYGPELAEASARSGALVAKILAGARPSELPVERPTKIQLIANVKTAKALGITIPPSILIRADEVIR